jgi:hypothetical protein
VEGLCTRVDVAAHDARPFTIKTIDGMTIFLHVVVMTDFIEDQASNDQFTEEKTRDLRDAQVCSISNWDGSQCSHNTQHKSLQEEVPGWARGKNASAPGIDTTMNQYEKRSTLFDY